MTIEHHLQTDGNIAKTWGNKNKMHIHYVKTSCMLAGTRHRLHEMPPLNLQIDGHDIKNVSQQKLLGLLIDDKLTWSAHIDNICSTLSSKIYLLRHLSNHVKEILPRIRLPLIDYGSITWSGTSSANIERILKLQKRAARIILHADYSKASLEMFSELGWQPIHKRLTYNKAVFTYKALNGQTPQNITDLLKPVTEFEIIGQWYSGGSQITFFYF